MKAFYLTLVVASALTIVAIVSLRQKAQPRNSGSQPTPAAKASEPGHPPHFVTHMPPGYRDWKLISVAREGGTQDDIRAILGNDIAVTAFREGTLPFPEGAIIARLAWSYDASEENNKAFGQAQSFVAGAPKNGVQFMVKDAGKYAATGGWGYAQFNDGEPAGESVMQSCHAFHQAISSRDFIFTRYAP